MSSLLLEIMLTGMNKTNLRLDDDDDDGGVGNASAQQGRGAVVLSRIQISTIQWNPRNI